MADIADIAQSEENQDRDAAIRAALAPPTGCEAGPWWEDGQAYCRECETLIPEKRLRPFPERDYAFPARLKYRRRELPETASTPENPITSCPRPVRPSDRHLSWHKENGNLTVRAGQ